MPLCPIDSYAEVTPEVTPGGSLSQKAFLELEGPEGRAPTNPTHAPSLSREADDYDRVDGSPEAVKRELWAPTDASPSGSSPFMVETSDHEMFIQSRLPQGKATVEMEGRNEIVLADAASSFKKTELPFSKKNRLWKLVESMDIFDKMPQQPHFRLVESHTEEFREGVAIGLMISFANIADSIQNLQVSDSQNIFKENLELLDLLELNGFNVQLLRSRLQELLDIIRSDVTACEENRISLTDRITEGEREKSRVAALIAAHDKKIFELKNELHRNQEKKMCMLSSRNSFESRAVQLQMDLQATAHEYHSAVEQFSSIAREAA